MKPEDVVVNKEYMLVNEATEAIEKVRVISKHPENKYVFKIRCTVLNGLPYVKYVNARSLRNFYRDHTGKFWMDGYNLTREAV